MPTLVIGADPRQIVLPSRPLFPSMTIGEDRRLHRAHLPQANRRYRESRNSAEPLLLVSRTLWLLPLTTTKIVPEMS